MITRKIFWAVQVTRVVDGDTFKAKTVSVLTPSLHITEDTGFRLLRVNTPERRKPGFKQATDMLRRRIYGKLIGIQLTTKRRKRDSFGRYLVEIFVNGVTGPVNVNDELRAKGWVWLG